MIYLRYITNNVYLYIRISIGPGEGGSEDNTENIFLRMNSQVQSGACHYSKTLSVPIPNKLIADTNELGQKISATSLPYN